MTDKFEHVRAVVFDWAGTTVDHGSLALAIQNARNIQAAMTPIATNTASRAKLDAFFPMPTLLPLVRSVL